MCTINIKSGLTLKSYSISMSLGILNHTLASPSLSRIWSAVAAGRLHELDCSLKFPEIDRKIQID